MHDHNLNILFRLVKFSFTLQKILSIRILEKVEYFRILCIFTNFETKFQLKNKITYYKRISIFKKKKKNRFQERSFNPALIFQVQHCYNLSNEGLYRKCDSSQR